MMSFFARIAAETAKPEAVPLLWVSVPIAFLFGAAVGSFLNVCIFRLPRNCLSVLKPLHSFCISCGRSIDWYDNIPIISYTALGGRCRKCRAQFSIRYALIEVLTAILFAWLAYEFIASRPKNPQWAMLFIGAVLTSAFIVIFFIDVDFRIIPNEIDVPGIIIAPVLSFLVPVLHGTAMWHMRTLSFANWPDATESLQNSTMPLLGTPLFDSVAALCHSIIGLLVGAGIIWSLGVLGGAIFRKTLEADEERELESLGISGEALAGEGGEQKSSPAMGLGDVKLMGMLGAFFGVIGVFVILVVGIFLGAVIGGCIRLFYRRGDAKVPFGPFLCVGAFAYLIAGSRILKFIWTDAWVFIREHRTGAVVISLTLCALCIALLIALRRRRLSD